MQRYFVILKNGEIFNTEWFDEENHWSEEYSKVIDTNTIKQFDGNSWIDIQQDHL